MEFTRNNDGTFTLDTSTRSVTLTANEVSFIVNQFNKIGLRDSIESLLLEMDGDEIELSMYPYSFYELVDEIFVDLEDEVDYGNLPDDDDIKEKILDTASFYDMLKE